MIAIRHYAAGATLGLAVLASGCAAPPMSVPSTAQMMSEGNSKVAYRPTQFGRVYVTDDTDHKIVYQGDADRDELVEVDSRADRISVGGRTVSELRLDDNHQYRVYFEPLSQARTVKYRVVEEPPVVR
jgi:hypothetical protein